MNDRTLYQIDQDVRFSARYHQLCERWFLMVNDAVNFLSIFFASGAAVAILKDAGFLAAMLGCVVALASAVNLTIGSVRKAVLHREIYRRYQDLSAEIADNKLTAQAADVAYLRLERDDPAIIEAFRKIAQIDSLTTHGHADLTAAPELKLSFREKLLRSCL